MKSPRPAKTAAPPNSLLWTLLTLEGLITGPLVHLVYWFGLGVIALGGFGSIGGAIGLALREGFPMGILLGIAFAGAGLLITAAMAIVWRSFCEFYVVMIQLGEDLRALRMGADKGLIQVRVTPAAEAAPESTLAPTPAAISAKRRRAVPNGDQ
jgi:hypothetical protein